MKEPMYKTAVTLIEMLIVIAVMSFMVSLVLGIAGSIQNQNNVRLTRDTIALLDTALQQYRDYRGAFPESAGADVGQRAQFLYEQLHALPESRKILEKIDDSLMKNVYGTDSSWPEIYDAWKQNPIDYEYVSGWAFPKLVSAGPDKEFGTGDDITNR